MWGFKNVPHFIFKQTQSVQSSSRSDEELECLVRQIESLNLMKVIWCDIMQFLIFVKHLWTCWVHQWNHKSSPLRHLLSWKCLDCLNCHKFTSRIAHVVWFIQSIFRGGFQCEDSILQCGSFHYKDKTVSWPSSWPLHVCTPMFICHAADGSLNIKMYGDSYYKDNMVLWPFYLDNGNLYTVSPPSYLYNWEFLYLERLSLYWDRALVPCFILLHLLVTSVVDRLNILYDWFI